jgi:ATP-dependent Clp protease ATP-binding subunit ClpC
MMQEDPETSALLGTAAVRENDFVSALKIEHDEQDVVFERVVDRAEAIAKRLGADRVRPIHLLAAITREPRSAGFRALERVGVPSARVYEASLRALGIEGPPETERAPSTVPQSSAMPSARPSTMPAAMPRPRTTLPPPMAGAPKPIVLPRPTALPVLDPRIASMRAAPSPSPSPRVESREGRISARPPASPGSVRPNRKVARTPERAADTASKDPLELDPTEYPTLCAIGRDLTALARAGGIDPVIGREVELEQLLDVLSRRRANNPLLVGPPGVGKTSLAHALALALANGKAPGMPGKILIEVSAGALVSGTSVRGALAERVRRLQTEVTRAGNVLLFLDDVHAVLGAGDGGDDVATELKSALARGDFPCIGATTEADARRHFDRDPALARRFSPVLVNEPSAADTKIILRGIVPSYEAHHKVRYEPEAIDAAVDLTVRYVTEKHLPDKAVSVLDLAAARARRAGLDVVDIDAVARVVASETHVPLERLRIKDGERLLRLEGELGERVVGQKASLERISDALRKSAAGFRGRRPLGTFLFLGPTGVGKTETAKAISDVLFGGTLMTRFDMSEMSESHAVARLFGAPPGYVGHESGGQLTEAVRRRPYQLILLDEIEKAHPEVLLSLLPLLDEGRATDARGRTVDFTNTVVVMTSNLGADAIGRLAAPRIGFGAEPSSRSTSAEDGVLAAARRALPPELWNRIDEPLFFGPLTSDDVSEIARRMISSLATALLREHGVTLITEPSAIEALVASGGFDAALGARPMRRTIGRLLESPIAARVLAGELRRGERLRIRGQSGRLVFDQGTAAGNLPAPV